MYYESYKYFDMHILYNIAFSIAFPIAFFNGFWYANFILNIIHNIVDNPTISDTYIYIYSKIQKYKHIQNMQKYKKNINL